MKLTINGETQDFTDGLTISGLVEALGLHPKKVAVERNLEVVPKSLHPETVLADGDRIEIVQFVGGG
ncbi:sulfur carrier protein ThiS [Hyphobacterium sp.]|uniref:sulfur carrier protein ThiS n=1 Tax=Hyphobacterium sp. TaxID=2004662 RepID=UPI00374A7B55